MAIKSREVLKTYFENGDKPNEVQFSDLIDSLIHVSEGGGTNTSDGPTGTGIVDGISTDEDGNIVFTFVGGNTINISSNGSVGTVKMPIPYVDSYDNFYFVSEEKGNDITGVPNSYRFYKSIVAASEAARANYDKSGSKNMVYVFKGTYNEESVNREYVDMYFEDGAVVWVEGTDSSVINDKLEPVNNANVYGKGTFVNKNYTSWDDREGINMRRASSMYIEAKLVDGIQLYLDDPIHFEFANIDFIYRITSHHNKSMKFKNCRFLNGLRVSSYKKDGGKEVYENCEFILPEFNTEDARNKSTDISDYKGVFLFRIVSGFLGDRRNPPVNPVNKNLDQIVAEAYSHASLNAESPEASCLMYYASNVSRLALGDFRLEVRNSKFTIKRENGIGAFLAKRKNSNVEEGYVIFDNVIIVDETASKNSVALVTGWGDAAIQQPELMINALSHNCKFSEKTINGLNKWEITFKNISNFVPKQGGEFIGRIDITNQDEGPGRVIIEPNGRLETFHKMPNGRGYGGGFQVSSDDEKGVVSFQFRTKPQNGSGDQTVQIGYYTDENLFKKAVHSLQMFQPNSLMVIGGWLGLKGSGEGYKEGDKFRVLNGNAEIDGDLRTKKLRVLDKLNLKTSNIVEKDLGGHLNISSKWGSWISLIDEYSNDKYVFHNPENGGRMELFIQDGKTEQNKFGAFTILKSGNIGIGTTNPQEKLHINGGRLRIQTPTGYADIGSENTNWFHFNTDRPVFYFNKGARMNGNLGIYNKDTYMRKSDGAIFENGVRVATQTWVNNLFVGTGSATKAKDADKLDGIDSAGFARQEVIGSKTLNKGWYTIAVNVGNRASAKFVLRETRSSYHQTIHFYASHHYGNGNNITVLSNGFYANKGAIPQIRIKEGGTYDGALLQVNIDVDAAPVAGWIFEDVQSSGWIPKAWIPDGEDPGNIKVLAKLTNIAVTIDLDKTEGINTSADIYVQGNKVYHEGFKPTAAQVGALAVSAKAKDADKLDGIESTSFLRSDINDTFTGMLSVGSTTKRQAGIYGVYDSKKTGHIWSIGTAYKIAADGSDFGNMFGFAYKHTNNATGGEMAAGHQAVWCDNGNPKVSLGANIWTAGDVKANGAYYWGDNKRIIQFSDSWLRINPAREFTSGIYCGSGILRTDGQFQVGPNGNKFKVETNGNTTVYGNLSGKIENGKYSHLYRFGGIHFTWDSDSYGTNAQHSIKSCYGTTFGDSLTMNSFNNIRLNIDSNNNNKNSKFEIGHNTSGVANVIFSVDEGGNMVASGNVSAYSDKRLKKALKPVAESFLEKIDQLKPTFFQWKDKAKDQGEQLGFIAQEVMGIFPQWVHKNKEHYSVSYDKMGAVLAVKGIQELHSEIKELKAQLKNLQHGVTY